MRQAKYLVGQSPLSDVPPLPGEEEFVLELTSRDGKRLQGSVLHPRSGRREAVTEWDDLTRIITRMLATTDGGAMPEADS
jgi:hypothetical protein